MIAKQRGALDGLGDIVVGLADTLVAADLSVLTLTLLHKSLELSIIGLGDSLGLHLHHKVATGSLDAGPHVLNGLLKAGNTGILVQAGVGQAV